MKIIVTGGAGFVASHIVDKYISLGHKVVVIDNLSTGFKKNLNKNATFYKVDICNAKKINEIFKKEKPDIVNHHAAIAEVVKSLRDPMETLKINVNGTINLLLASGQNKVKRFIFPSTGGAIYGEPKKIPVDESVAEAPLSPYGLSKHLGEISIDFYARMYDFKYCIFRYANVFGPRQNPKGEAGVVAIFGGMMKEGKRPTIFGDGTKTRDYVFIHDIVDANILALTKGENDIINIGCKKGITDQKIFDTIAKELGFKQKVKYAPFRKGEVLHITITNKKAKEIIGWTPKVSFEDGIRKTLETL